MERVEARDHHKAAQPTKEEAVDKAPKYKARPSTIRVIQQTNEEVDKGETTE